jgi:asparagine synthase (glutamine-hydrolysing)
MCGIMIGPANEGYNPGVRHRGLNTNIRSAGDLILTHEHLPIQSMIGDKPIIETLNYLILFNGELFIDDCDNDLEYIEHIFSNMLLDYAIDHIISIDGFFSFIIYNKVTGDIKCFTDPLGKKQLYYSEDSIASELRPLKKGQIDNKFLSTTIKFGYVTDNSTPYMNIKRVLPNRIYTFNKHFEFLSASELLYKFKKVDTTKVDLYDLIDKAVKNRLKGHEEVGLLLSGGLDSSIIYHHAKGQIGNTYCVDNLKDLEHAKLIDPYTVSIRIKNCGAALDAMEMPLDLGSMYPQYSLFSKVDETVILTGDGADEAFGGYRRMLQYDSQLSDIFDELPFYHNIRIDRMSMIHTKECRSPFMSLPVIEYAMSLPYEERVNKSHLRDRYKGILPDSIVNRPKEPLKTDKIRSKNGVDYRKQLVDQWRRL